MNKSLGNRRTIILATILLLVVVANMWIFLPQFVFKNHLMTAEKLSAHQAQLSHSTNQAADLLFKVDDRTVTSEDVDQQLEEMVHDIDSVILELRSTEHEVELQEEVQQTLETAEVVSFTLHTYRSKSEVDPLTSSKTAHILHQAVRSTDQALD